MKHTTLRPSAIKLLPISIAVIFSASTFSGVQVNLVEPERYTDIQDTNSSRKSSIEDFEKEMKSFFDSKSKAVLKSGHNLSVDILDVDRAGDLRYNYTATHEDMRILRDTVRVRVKLKYTISDSDKNVIKSGEEHLKEFYQVGSIDARKNQREKLYYEKKLISDWLDKLY